MEAHNAEVARITSSVQFWRVVCLIVVAGTVLPAVGTMVAQWMELRFPADLSTRHRGLLRLKDQELQKLRSVHCTVLRMLPILPTEVTNPDVWEE